MDFEEDDFEVIVRHLSRDADLRLRSEIWVEDPEMEEVPKAKRMDKVMQGENEGKRKGRERKGKERESAQNRNLGPDYMAVAGPRRGRLAREVSRGQTALLSISLSPQSHQLLAGQHLKQV